MKGLSTCHEIGRPFGETRLVRKGLDVANVRCTGGMPGPLDHPLVGLDTHNLLGAFGPDPSRKAGSGTEIDDEPRPVDRSEEGKDLEQRCWRRRPGAVVDVGEAVALVPRTVNECAREVGHGAILGVASLSTHGSRCNLFLSQMDTVFTPHRL